MKKFLIICLIFVSIIVLFWKNILIGYASFFEINNITPNADAIIVLGGNPKTRVVKAVEVMRDFNISKVFLTTMKDEQKTYSDIFKTNTQLSLEVFERENIQPTIIPSQKDGVVSTFDEAIDTAIYLKKHPEIKHLIIITDKFHTRRAYYAFKKIFSIYRVDVKLEIAGATNLIYNNTNWWLSENGFINYIAEPLKFILYILHDKNLEMYNNE